MLGMAHLKANVIIIGTYLLNCPRFNPSEKAFLAKK